MSTTNEHVFLIQDGSSADLRVADESKFYLVRETWNGSRMVDTKIVSSHDTREEAAKARKDAISRSDAAASMGAVKSERKAATSRENGKRGGRPRKT